MAEENQKIETTTTTPVVGGEAVEAKDRGLFDFLGKKEEVKPQEEVIASEFDEKVKISETEHKSGEHKEEEGKEEKPGGILEKLHRTSSSSSSSSDEEGEGEEKKKKKEKKKKHEEDVTVPVEIVDESVPEEKKGFLEKIKEKLPGQSKKTEGVTPSPPPTPPATESVTEAATHEGDAKEKKGFLDKIKEKIPGYHAKTEEEKEKEKEIGSH